MEDSRAPAPSQLSAYILQTLQRPGQPALFEAFAALSELHTRQPSLITGEHLAAAAQALITAEIQPGGPYITQEFTEEGLLTNAAIAHFMQQLGTPLPNLAAYVEQALRLHQLGMLTVSPETSYYLLRASGLQLQASPPNTVLLPPSLQTAHQNIVQECERIISNSPTNIRPILRKALQDILKADTNHEISLLPFFFLESLKEKTGKQRQLCQILGVANIFCWIAYTAYDNILDEEASASLQLPLANIAHRFSYSLYLQVSKDRKTSRHVTHIFNTMDAANYWELHNCRAILAPHTTLELDGMPAQPTLTIRALPRYGKRTILARRSFAHTLGPLLLLTHAGYPPESPQFTYVKQGMEHFLIARQLQDDLHDWVKDLRVGQLNFVVTDLLRQLHTRSGTYALNELEGRMKQVFWRQGLTHTCTIVTHHTRNARASLENSGLVTDLFTDHRNHAKRTYNCCAAGPANNFLGMLIHRLECAASQAERNYRQSQQFVAYYQ